MPLTIKPVTQAVGAEISGVNLAKVERCGILRRSSKPGTGTPALLFRDQKTDRRPDLLAFSAACFGELDPPPIQEHGRPSCPKAIPTLMSSRTCSTTKALPSARSARGKPCGTPT